MIKKDDFENFVKLVGRQKVLIAIGGITQKKQLYQTAANEKYRNIFVQSVLKFLDKHGIAGITLDWYDDYQNKPDDMIALLDKFDEQFAKTSYLLGVTVPGLDPTYYWTPGRYDYRRISQLVDFINVLTIDYAVPGFWYAGNVSPLQRGLDFLRNLNERYHVRRSQLHYSVQMFARTWSMSSDANGPNGSPGELTQKPGFLSYNEVCQILQTKSTQIQIVRDNIQDGVKVTYQHDRLKEMYAFDDSKSLAAKVYNITSEGFGGIAVYALANDDFRGLCGKKFPLLHAINDNLNRDDYVEAKVKEIIKPTESDVAGHIDRICKKEGFVRDSVYCHKYYKCIEGDFGLEETPMTCKSSEGFDEVKNMCVPKENVKACR